MLINFHYNTMFSRASRSARSIGRRFNSHATHEAPKSQPFTNKFNFNIEPPQVHQYWNYKNTSVLLAFIPFYLAAGYLGQYTGSNLTSWEGFWTFADGEHSPLKQIKFGEAQQKPETN